MPILHDGVKSGRLDNDGILHMAKDAKKPDQYLATEDGNGKFNYKKGFEVNISRENMPATALSFVVLTALVCHFDSLGRCQATRHGSLASTSFTSRC